MKKTLFSFCDGVADLWCHREQVSEYAQQKVIHAVQSI